MKTAFLGEDSGSDGRLVGAKAATLSRLADRFRVPAGFCLDATVFDRLGPAVGGDAGSLATLRALVEAGHRGLEWRTGRRAPLVAVRSSAIGEDGAETSFAGQHETLLDVSGVDAIVDAVVACWRSGSSERAVAYRREHGIADRARIGVLGQEMVPADAAAIAFSDDPVARERDVGVVDACIGNGEALASGTGAPGTDPLPKAGPPVVN